MEGKRGFSILILSILLCKVFSLKILPLSPFPPSFGPILSHWGYNSNQLLNPSYTNNHPRPRDANDKPSLSPLLFYIFATYVTPLKKDFHFVSHSASIEIYLSS